MEIFFPHSIQCNFYLLLFFIFPMLFISFVVGALCNLRNSVICYTFLWLCTLNIFATLNLNKTFSKLNQIWIQLLQKVQMKDALFSLSSTVGGGRQVWQLICNDLYVTSYVTEFFNSIKLSLLTNYTCTNFEILSTTAFHHVYPHVC